jgi:ATP-dependent Clp protease ATP-binding subunit ClpB
MNNTPGNFTHKAQEAILQAQNIAQEKGQQQVDALHLLYSLIAQEDSILGTLLSKIGADLDGLKRKVEIALDRFPVSATPAPFGQFYLTQDLGKVL